MEQIAIDALSKIAVDSPVLLIVLVAVWDLRKNLLACISHNAELMDRLLDIVLEDD